MSLNTARNLKYKAVEDFPIPGKTTDPDSPANRFWNQVESQDYQSSLFFVLLNSLKVSNPLLLTDSQCRFILGKAIAMVEMIDLPAALKTQQQDPKEESTDDPFTY